MASPLPAAAEVSTSRRNTRPGGVEDRYRSLFVIGRGGMGTVEVALEHGPQSFERVVALKRLLPEGARDPRHKEMFLREARLAALLAHPNVVHAFAFGEVYGQLFMAMEYVEGEPLSAVLTAARGAEGGLSPALVAFVLAQVCDGLHAAHELRGEGPQGLPLHVVHRDVSPHNVMIAYEGQVKLLDFGVAKFETGGQETRTGEVKGKMAYMSPEQALGEKLDRRSDLFSVGAVLFECLTGARMWGPGTDLEVMRKLALEQPPGLETAMAHAPPELVDLHTRLVAHDPSRRPSTAREVADELRAFARSRGAGVDTEAVRLLMLRLFAREAEERRALLTESLERADPLRVDELRRSLEAEGDLRTSTEPLIVRSTLAPPAPRRRRKAVFAAVALGLLGASALAALAVESSTRVDGPPKDSRLAPAPARPAETGAPAASIPATASSSTPPVPFLPASSPPPSTPPLSPSAALPAGSLAPAPPVPSSTTRSRLAFPVQTAPSAPPGPPKLPDVDPTPF